jgi:ABC-2 type transport system permease protein
VTVERRGEVFDLGYQHYDGPREGRARARLALWTNGVRTALGIGRGGRSKVLPILLFAAVVAPALFIVLMTAIAAQAGAALDGLPGHEGYYQVVSVIVLLFAAIIAPELLTTDRRDGVLNLYLVRPLSATDYVMGRWLAFFSITLAILYAGQVVLLVGLVLAAADPVEYLRENWLDVPRFLLAGAVIAVFTTTLPLAVSAFTTRRAYVAAFVIGLYFITAAVVGALTSEQCTVDVERTQLPGGDVVERPVGEPVCTRLAGESSKWVALLDIGQTPLVINDMVFASEEPDDNDVAALVRELPAGVPIAWYVLLVALPGYALWQRYRRLAS